MSASPLAVFRARVARGFTLIELLIAITLAALLIMIALPSFITWTRNAQIRSSAEALQNGLRTGQTEALRRNRSVALTFTNATPGPGAASAAGGKNWSLETVPKFGETAGEYITGAALGDVASGVAIAASAAGTTPSVICFDSNGRLATIPAVGCALAVTDFDVTQTNADRALRVTVQLGGQLRMCDPKRTRSSTSPDGCT